MEFDRCGIRRYIIILCITYLLCVDREQPLREISRQRKSATDIIRIVCVGELKHTEHQKHRVRFETC